MALPRVVLHALSRSAASLDRGALRLMGRTMRRGARTPPDNARELLTELAAHYETARVEGSFFPAPAAAEVRATRAPSVAGATALDLAYASTYRPHLPGYREEFASYHENLTAHARLYTGGTRRPTLICIHGWGGGSYWLEERAFVVPYLIRIGLDVVLFQLPFHGARIPVRARATGAGSLFPSSHVARTNEAFGQAIHDLRALAAWLRERGAPHVGVAGMSLGGYTAALWASLDSQLACAIPMIPAVSMSELMWRHGAGSPARRRAQRAGVSQDLLDEAFAVHAPMSRPVALPADRLLILAGRGDRITPPDQAEALWRHWDEPDIYWFAGGHLAQIGRGGAFRAVRGKLARLGLARGPSRG